MKRLDPPGWQAVFTVLALHWMLFGLCGTGCRSESPIDYNFRIEDQPDSAAGANAPGMVELRQTIAWPPVDPSGRPLSQAPSLQAGKPFRLIIEFERSPDLEEWPRFVMASLFTRDIRSGEEGEQVASDVGTIDLIEDVDDRRRASLVLDAPREPGRYFLMVTSMDLKQTYVFGWVSVEVAE